MVGNVFSFLSSVSWSIRSKHLAMSASSKYLALYLIELNIASIASWHERPGRNPYELGSNRASHSGSRTILTSACKARSFIVGMPSGRFSSVPGLGIHTRLVGATFEPNFRLTTKDRRCFGVRLFSPSTPAVFFPWLSCVTRLTAKHLADQDFINVFWSLRIAFTSPRIEAR